MADVELLPCPECGMPCRAGEYHPFAACLMFKACHNSETVRANLAPLQAEIEALRAEVREAREFRDKMANAIGNDQLRRFIEKHGEPVPLTIRMQEAEARAERLEEALRRYRNEVPLGHQPQMLAHEVDDMLNHTAAQEGKESFWPKLPVSGEPDWTGYD